ncbi:hypothetical protein Fleli_1251 [Bernardetia litoralis DSM 6794]|uniref:Uncharacterized protein n=1 Tax=Bernardetia litoralis (strain ATCC 23117 / DSM 6794 / NBRC 15988 / NCIMB 1366 / Fx l1 / Sio-4) TaxID=880071 RepID=I4AIA2_BERLS|nr:hypothetical protein [Bernardetia litoralis]AFM03687.1 hypothetical protein Fleli_1251 [Bernardetia litoralis DSM 6794]
MFKKSTRLPKHKKFEFQPRFYNADKEDFEKRKRWTEAEEKLKELDKEQAKDQLNELSTYNEENSILRGSFGRAKEKRKTLFGNMSVVVLIALLGGSTYIFANLGSGGKDLGWEVYIILLLVPIYILFRIRANSKIKKEK